MSTRTKGIIALAVIVAVPVIGLMPTRYIEGFAAMGLIIGVPLGLLTAVAVAVWAIVTNRSPLHRR